MSVVGGPLRAIFQCQTSFKRCLGDLVVEAILAPPSVLKGSLVESPCCCSLCQFPKKSFKKCLGDLVVEAVLAPPSVLKGSLAEWR